VDALYCGRAPTEAERRSRAGFTIQFRCLKQREGALLPIDVVVSGQTNAIAEEVRL